MRLGYKIEAGDAALMERAARFRGRPEDEAIRQARMQVGLGPGDVLDDRFLVIEVLNQGGMATIFKALDLQNRDREVVVKVPYRGMESNPASYARFAREEEIGLKLDHPFVMKFIGVNGNRSRPYIVAEYLRGNTLADILGKIRPLPEKDALKLVSLICEALQYLHAHNIVHRDLKPSNVMVCSDGTIRVMDFGISYAEAARRVTFAGFSTAMGTADYVAPEQIKGRRGDQRTDIYSLGSMLYEMLTGKAPFDGDDPFIIMNRRMSGDPAAPRKLNPSLSPQAEEIVLRALQRDPNQRYQSAAAMKADLDAPEKMPVTGLCHALKESTRWRRFLLLARWITLTCIIPLIVQVVLFFVLWHHFAKKR
ncbi:MAG: serine/threonine-protein kinase [Verrucomicrobiia bacterium]|jgi:serine/threonine-protein kinase